MRLSAAVLAALPVMAQNYSIERLKVDDTEVIRLVDAARDVRVSVAPSLGNNAYEMKVKGRDIMWSPFMSLAEYRAKPRHMGNPFLAPWANRLDHDGFWANGRHYVLNPELKNFGRDQHGQPIHGLVVNAPWEVVEAKADAQGAVLVSRLEFFKRPDWMAQFPFAHTYEVTHRLADGVLEVRTVVKNLSSEAMPVSVAYHPYFRLHDAPRDQWKVHLPAREHVVLSEKLTPTGEHRPVDLPDPVGLEGRRFDDVFAGLVRGADGRAEFWFQGAKEKVSVLFGPKYTVAVVYAPPGRDFICFEPMSGPTNAFNLSQAGKYRELQSIPPGGEWQESFWIQATGF